LAGHRSQYTAVSSLTIRVSIGGGFEQRLDKVLVVHPRDGLSACVQVSPLAKFNHVINVLSNCPGTNQSSLDSSVSDNFSGQSTQQGLSLISRLSKCLEPLSVRHLKRRRGLTFDTIDRSSHKGWPSHYSRNDEEDVRKKMGVEMMKEPREVDKLAQPWNTNFSSQHPPPPNPTISEFTTKTIVDNRSCAPQYIGSSHCNRRWDWAKTLRRTKVFSNNCMISHVPKAEAPARSIKKARTLILTTTRRFRMKVSRSTLLLLHRHGAVRPCR